MSLCRCTTMPNAQVAGTYKEEVDGPGPGPGLVAHRRGFSGSQRSFDFDNEGERLRRRSHRRSATLSRNRERDQTPQQQQQEEQQPESRERSQSNSRRVSRSPVRRSESPKISHSGKINSNNTGNGGPVKLVSVPATVTSLTADKVNNVSTGDMGTVRRVLVRRNVGSPRSQSPARSLSPGCRNGNGCQQVVSISRNGSRRAEHSPYRRTPLDEIDKNSVPFHPLSDKELLLKGKDIEEDDSGRAAVKQPVSSGIQYNKLRDTNILKASSRWTHRRTKSTGEEFEVKKTNYCRVNEHQTLNVKQATDNKREQLGPSQYDDMVTPVVVSTNDTTLKLPQTFVRSRSGRLSRDLDINVEALLSPNPATNYNFLLLRDIQNFHKKKSSNSNANCCNNAVNSNIDPSTPPFPIQACVSKAQSILKAVADLNSTVGSNLKCSREPSLSFRNVNNKRVYQSKDPFVESEVKVGDDLMEPSLHKYVTVTKRGGDMDDEDSSESNSFVGSGCPRNWVSSSWEPISADSSTDCWVSKSYTREEGSPIGFQRNAISAFGSRTYEEPEKKFDKVGVVRTKAVAGRDTVLTSKPAAATM